MNARFILSNIQQFMALVKDKPGILNIGAFSTLRPAYESYNQQPKSGCNCKSGNNLNNYRTQFESAVKGLSAEDKTRLKDILQSEQICYYGRGSNGGLTLECF